MIGDASVSVLFRNTYFIGIQFEMISLASESVFIKSVDMYFILDPFHQKTALTELTHSSLFAERTSVHQPRQEATRTASNQRKTFELRVQRDPGVT
jgi:hypothetical protein